MPAPNDQKSLDPNVRVESFFGLLNARGEKKLEENASPWDSFATRAQQWRRQK
jgi:hypothetical protein